MKTATSTESGIDKQIDEQLKALSVAERFGLLQALIEIRDPVYKAGFSTGLRLSDKLTV